MSYDTDFLNDSVGFMRRHIVLQMVAGEGVVGATGQFEFKETEKHGTLYEGGACPILEMQVAAKGGFKAYWCPYREGAVRAVTLAAEADRMFTAKMDGCSFGIGVPGPDGAVRVAHANLQESEELDAVMQQMFAVPPPKPGGAPLPEMRFLEIKKTHVKTAQQGAQLQSGDGVDGPLSNDIGPANYRGLMATTFGVRGDGGWAFHYQAFAKQGNGFKLYGCFPFPTRG